jgi:hypothetical protein
MTTKHDKKDKSIICLMNDLEDMESFLSNCESIEYRQRKYWAQVCRVAINKFTAIFDFIRKFLPNFMRNQNDEVKK